MSDKVHVIFNGLSLRSGGGLTVLLGVVDGIHQLSPDWDMTVVCSADDTAKAVNAQGIANCSQILRNAGGIGRQLWTSLCYSRFVKQLQSDSPTVLLSFNQFINGIKCPQIVYHINLLRFLPVDRNQSLKNRFFDHLRNYSSRQALRFAAANVFESEYIRDLADGIFDSRNRHSSVIYIGLPESLTSGSHFSSDGYRPGNLMSITNGNPHKDNSTLLGTVKELVCRRPEVNWKLQIAGGLDEQKWNKYRLLAEQLEITDHVEWLGFLDESQLTHHLQQSLCLVSTSRIESFCMVACESMARGCPPIVANATSMPESVEDAGMLCPPGNCREFADAVIKLYDQQNFREELVQKGLDRVRTLSWRQCGSRFVSLIRKLTASQ